MLYLVTTAALAFALNAEPAPKPYGPAIEAQPAAARISNASEDTPRTNRASDLEASARDEDRHRAYVCVDDDCKTVSPVYNTRTPAEADTRSFRASW